MTGRICRPLYNVRECHVEKGHMFSTSTLLNLLRFSQRNHINQICFQLYEKYSLNGSQLTRKLNIEENLDRKKPRSLNNLVFSVSQFVVFNSNVNYASESSQTTQYCGYGVIHEGNTGEQELPHQVRPVSHLPLPYKTKIQRKPKHPPPDRSTQGQLFSGP